MTTPAHRLLLLSAAALVTSGALAQNAPPAAETPRPQDIDPAVNTSAPAAESQGEAQRPQDIDPAIDTSAAKPNEPDAAARDGQQANPQAGAAPGQGQAARTTARGRAVDRLELDTTQITGNRELPKVLYIVPWKRSDLGDLVGKPVNSLLDEVLTPVDRDVFRRENRYYRALTPGSDEGATQPTGPQARAPEDSGRSAAGSVGSATKSSTGSGSAAPPARDER